MKIVIVGNGIVGGNMRKLFPDADIHDPPQGIIADQDVVYDLAFVCVPTPCRDNGECNTDIVVEALDGVRARIYCIRSTVPPGTCTEIQDASGKKIVFMPEYYGETVHANAVDYGFIILAGDRKNTAVVAEAYKEISTGNLRIFQTTFETAELVKYAENCFLAVKVTFCNEFYRIAGKIGVDYNEFRELFIADPRIGRSHTFVYDSHPYYESKCLDKDVPALVAFAESIGCDPSLMRAVYMTNNKHKRGQS